MKFTKKNKILLLVLLVILNAVIRIPLVPHELGTDSFYIHQISDSITDYGEAKWVRHPVQFFGFGTTPPALPILISGFSQCLGISSELSIFLLSFLAGIFGAIIAYTFMYYVTNDDCISFLGALLFSLSPEFLRITIWTATTRSLFIALLPLFLYLLFKTINTKRKLSYIVLLFSIYVLLMATHHMGVLLLFYLCSLFTLLLFKFSEKIKFIELINAKVSAFMWIPLFLLLFLPVVLKLGFFKDYSFLWNAYLGGHFFRGEGFHVVPLNLAIDYASKMGILLPFAIIGIIGLLSKTKRRTFESYVLVLLLLAAPIMGVGVYAPMLLLIIFAFLVAIGLTMFMDINVVKNKVKIVLPLFLVAMLCFSMFMLASWGSWTGKHIEDKYIEHTKNTAIFIKNYANGTFTSNERSYIYKHSVYSGVPSAPGYVYNFRFMEKNNLTAKLNLDIKSVFKGKGENIIIFEHVGNESLRLRNPWYLFGYVWVSDPDGNRELLDRYNIKYCVETNFGKYRYSEYFAKKKELFVKMHGSRPKIYDNKMEEIYFIG